MADRSPRRKPQARKKAASAKKTRRTRGKATRPKAARAQSGAADEYAELLSFALRASEEDRHDEDLLASVLEVKCRKLIELVRKRCPGMLPTEPLTPGTVAAPIEIKSTEARALITVAARQSVLESAGAPVPSDVNELPASVLWQEGADALMIEVARIDVRVGAGLVTVTIPVICDQLRRGRGVVDVDFVVGTPDRPTGLLAAATEPRGPRVIVRRWSDALTALAWQSVLASLGGVAAAAGIDRDGAALIPTALTATPAGLGITVQARHDIDRVRPGRVVTPRPALRMSRP